MEQQDMAMMRLALQEAETAAAEGEIPIGCVITCRGRVITRTHNLSERLNDVTAHAEMQAITAAADAIGGKYLDECTLYVTLEPCPMCASALFWAHLGRLVYAAPDPKRGCSLFSPSLLHPSTKVTSGLLASEAADLMKAFFRKRRS